MTLFEKYFESRRNREKINVNPTTAGDSFDLDFEKVTNFDIESTGKTLVYSLKYTKINLAD